MSRPKLKKREKKAALTPAWQVLGEDIEREFYKLLVTHTFAEAAVQIGLDAHYQGESLRNAAYQLYKRLDPIKLGISPDVKEMVEAAIHSRKIAPTKAAQENHAELSLPGAELLDPTDSHAVIIGGRNKAAMLLHKKFDLINKSKKQLEDVSLSQLGTVFGILFDKSQILQGQATENIAVMSKKYDEAMTPEATLDAILKLREDEIAKKAEK